MPLKLEVKPYVRPARLEDVSALLSKIDPVDAEEITVVFEKSPERGLLESYLNSVKVWTICTSQAAVCGMFGLVPLGTTTGSPWMVKGKNFPEVTTQFIRQCRGWVEEMQSVKPHLSNIVLSKNTKAIRWLKFCGFKLAEKMPYYGHFEVNVTRFYKVR